VSVGRRLRTVPRLVPRITDTGSARTGQWAPMVGTLFAALGSLYLLLAEDAEEAQKGSSNNGSSEGHQCTCSHHHLADGDASRAGEAVRSETTDERNNEQTQSPDRTNSEKPREASVAQSLPQPGRSLWADAQDPETLATTNSEPIPMRPDQRSMSLNTDVGGRRKVARTLTAISTFLGTPARDAFDDSDFKRGRAVDFPEIPGEASRNRALSQIREQYNQPRDGDGNVTPGLQRQRSRNASPTGSYVSGLGITETPRRSRSSSSSSSPPRSPRRPHSNTFPIQRRSVDVQIAGPASPNSEYSRRRSRRDTLEVPSPTRHAAMRNELSSQAVTSAPDQDAPGPASPPMIVVSPDPDTESFDLTPRPSSPLAAVDCELSSSPPRLPSRASE